MIIRMNLGEPSWRSAYDHAADIVRALKGRRRGVGWYANARRMTTIPHRLASTRATARYLFIVTPDARSARLSTRSGAEVCGTVSPFARHGGDPSCRRPPQSATSPAIR
jgi:hypothetical protein